MPTADSAARLLELIQRVEAMHGGPAPAAPLHPVRPPPASAPPPYPAAVDLGDDFELDAELLGVDPAEAAQRATDKASAAVFGGARIRRGDLSAAQAPKPARRPSDWRCRHCGSDKRYETEIQPRLWLVDRCGCRV